MQKKSMQTRFRVVVVVFPPFFDQDLGFSQALEDFAI
jgi:hypothetical protein